MTPGKNCDRYSYKVVVARRFLLSFYTFPEWAEAYVDQE